MRTLNDEITKAMPIINHVLENLWISVCLRLSIEPSSIAVPIPLASSNLRLRLSRTALKCLDSPTRESPSNHSDSLISTRACGPVEYIPTCDKVTNDLYS